MKLNGRVAVLLFVGLGLTAVYATDQILPATSAYQAQMRIWLAARATGLASLILLTGMVVLGIVLSHPEQGRWKQSKRIYPWHESLWIFVLAFIAVHIVSLVIDPYAGVGIAGSLIPGLSEYRSWPVALGTISLYALLIMGLTARYTRLLPNGAWLKLHRFSVVVLGVAWAHGVLAGTDTDAFAPIYWGIALAVAASAAYRYWIVKRRAAHQRPGPTHLIPALVEESHVQPDPAP
jgi:predicted ferric reductase